MLTAKSLFVVDISLAEGNVHNMKQLYRKRIYAEVWIKCNILFLH